MLLAVSDQFESPNPNPTPINAGPIQSRIIFFTETDLFKTEGGVATDSVSYTHLTLPTICSV